MNDRRYAITVFVAGVTLIIAALFLLVVAQEDAAAEDFPGPQG